MGTYRLIYREVELGTRRATRRRAGFCGSGSGVNGLYSWLRSLYVRMIISLRMAHHHNVVFRQRCFI